MILADLLNRVFTVYVRPRYTTSQGNTVLHQGKLYVSDGLSGETRYIQVSTNNTVTEANSPTVLNTEARFKEDPWMLYGTWTSYAKLQKDLKDIIYVYGTGNVRASVHIPIDYQVLPIE